MDLADDREGRVGNGGPWLGLLFGSAPIETWIRFSADRDAMGFDRVLTNAEISGVVLAGVARDHEVHDLMNSHDVPRGCFCGEG